MEEVSPTSTAVLKSVQRFCDLLGRKLKLVYARERYRRGWGPNTLGAARVIEAWTLYIKDLNNNKTLLTFYIMNYESTITTELI